MDQIVALCDSLGLKLKEKDYLNILNNCQTNQIEFVVDIIEVIKNYA